MKRFYQKDMPVTLRSVIGIDRTFNLGPCFVTTLVYKNKSVVRKTNNEHPIFLGPVMFHFDGKTDSYTAFFSPLSTVLGVHGVHCTQSLWTTAILYLDPMRKRQLSMLFGQSFTLQVPVSKHYEYEALYINPTQL